jgi:two-component system, OmpR family, sensor histidine kinase BaeS
VWPGRAPAGSGPWRGVHHAAGTVVTATITATIQVAGQDLRTQDLGTVELRFGSTPASGGRTVAWQLVAAAGAAAILLALAMSWYVARRLSVPLVAVTRAARAFASGDRAVRTRLRAPGELGELASAVDAMADQVTHAEQLRRQLSADVAHELRTPLASLQAGLEELRDGLAEPDPARLASLHDQSLRLGRVVEDLAELSAAESAAPSLRRVDVDAADIVTAALDGQESRLRSAGLHLHRDIRSPVVVDADPDRLHQAVSNLLTNAARYCRPGDHVQISVDTIDHYARIRVADTGPGIESADLPHVFDRLWRGRSSRSAVGTGIGLAVVRELIAAHGGIVDAESRPGRGSTFTIRLPLLTASSSGRKLGSEHRRADKLSNGEGDGHGQCATGHESDDRPTHPGRAESRAHRTRHR